MAETNLTGAETPASAQTKADVLRNKFRELWGRTPAPGATPPPAQTTPPPVQTVPSPVQGMPGVGGNPLPPPPTYEESITPKPIELYDPKAPGARPFWKIPSVTGGKK